MSSTTFRSDFTRIAGKWGARHYLTPDGRKLPSVTTILQIVGKPALINWAAKTERELVTRAAADQYEASKAALFSRDAFTLALQERIGTLKAFEKEQQKALDVGTQAHEMIEWWLRRELGQEAGKEPAISQEALQSFVAFQGWWKDSKLRPIVIEQAVWNPTAGYAGTLDLYVEHAEHGLGVWDIKTAKGIYDEYWMQIAAYAMAVNEMGHGPVLHGGIIRVPKIAGDTLEARMISGIELADAYQSFSAFFTGWRWLEARKAQGGAP